jgi:hypothetical protein
MNTPSARSHHPASARDEGPGQIHRHLY